MEPSGSREVVVVRVADGAEELAVLQALNVSPRPASGRNVGQAGAKVVPVVNHLVPAVCRIGSAHDYAFRVIDVSEFLAGGPGRSEQRGCSDSCLRHELAILPLAGVTDQAILLTEHLCGGAVLSDIALYQGLPGSFRKVLVLFSPQTPADDFCRALALLAQHDVSFGVLSADDSDRGRLSLLKSLLFATVEIRDVDQIEDLASQAIVDRSITGATDGPSDRDRRILLLSGHGNSVDLGGRGVVICPRTRPDESRSPGDMTGLYPCFADGLCFRQPLFGRSPASVEGLSDPALFRYPVVLLLGCGTLPLDDRPFHRSGTILWRMAESGALAAVATLGAFYHDLNVEAALLSFLLDGHEFGTAVRLFNAWHRASYGPTSPAKEGYGPLVAVGHPGLRLKSSLIHDLGAFRTEEDFPVSIPSDAIPFSHKGRAILKFRSTSVERLPMALHAPRPLKGAAISVVLGADDESLIFVALQTDGMTALEEPVELSVLPRQSFERDLATLRDALPYLGFWRLLLTAASGPLAAALGPEGERLVADIGSLELESILLGYLSARPFEKDGALPTSSTIAVHMLVMDRWRNWQRLVLDAVCLYVQRTGGFIFHAWQKLYARSCSEGGHQKCPSCTRETSALSYHSHTDPSDRHQILHCTVCGVLGELPPAIAVRACDPIEACHGTLTARFEIKSERSASVHGFLTLIRESWFHSLHDTVEPTELIIDAGGERAFSISLPISGGLAPGLYPLVLVGVLNGGLVQLRYHVSIVDTI